MIGTAAGHVALIGLSGSGKSSLASLLSSRLGLGPAIDLDRVVEATLGAEIHEVFERDGEAAFRIAESDALAAALAGPPSVIATGGGIVLDAGNRSLLRRGATVVWLRATVGELARRLSDTTEARPLLAGDVDFALSRLEDERSALYAEVADLVVDVDGVIPEDLAVEVIASLEQRE